MAITRYCEPEDLARFGISQAALSSIPVDDEQLPAIDAASDVIDSYLRSRFTLPLMTVTNDIKRACAILAVYDLMSTRGYNPGDNADDGIRLRYLDILAWLRMIAEGKVTPEVTDSSPAAGPGTTASAARGQISSNSQRGWQSGETSGVPFQGRR